MKMGIHRDLGQLQSIIAKMHVEGDAHPGCMKALETIYRLLETLARDVDEADYTANSAHGAMRRYGMR